MLEIEAQAADGRVQQAQRVIEQLLSGLVAFEDDNAGRVRHRR